MLLSARRLATRPTVRKVEFRLLQLMSTERPGIEGSGCIIDT